jgi:L-seryl-tRNA(Ser) seleniumtransferase
VADSQKLRDLPSVHEVWERVAPSLARFPRTLVVEQIRRTLEDLRAEILSLQENGLTAEARVELALHSLEKSSLRAVINATGVVLHTNLGRAPLGATAVMPGYSNLEYDLATGRRGKRDVHVSGLLDRLLGVPGIVVNNNAAAIFLALHELASGGEVVVSRGELIEIGDGFRIPDIMARSGAILREVGTTNRTRIDDYRDAINDRTRLLLRVHPSNFRMVGFTARPELRELAALARERGLPLFEDLGSGCIANLSAFGIDEPLVGDSLHGGVDLVCFSGDKLLGGPQAGILAGKPELVARLRRNPLFRALRVDKMIYQVLEKTLRHLLLEQWESIPALAMIRQTPDEIRVRAAALIERVPGIRAEIVAGNSVIGGGATPEQPIPTWLIAIECASVVDAERALRLGDPPIIARIEGERLILDLRTVFRQQEDDLVRALASTWAGVGQP